MTTYNLLTREYECGCRFTEEELRKLYRLPYSWSIPPLCPTHSAPQG